jgi:DnaK suppressor protein
MEQVKIGAALEAKHNELLSGMNNREDIRVENAADVLDNLQLHMDREVVIRKLDSYSALLRDVDSALQRLEAGTFGICVECEEDIPTRRLQALPWAARCVPCQEKAERRTSKAADSFWPVDEH